MRHLHLVVVAVAVSLLTLAIACNSDDAPTATNTPATTGTEATATIALEPTAALSATATPLLAADGPCPINDAEFCDLARTLDAALKNGNLETIVAATRRGSQTCWTTCCLEWKSLSQVPVSEALPRTS